MTYIIQGMLLDGNKFGKQFIVLPFRGVSKCIIFQIPKWLVQNNIHYLHLYEILLSTAMVRKSKILIKIQNFQSINQYVYPYYKI